MSALSDAQQVLKADPDTLDVDLRRKALYRAAKAQYYRRDLGQAKVLFEEYLALNGEPDDVLTWLERTEQRLEESSQGKYDWIGLLNDLKINLHPDVADYQGPIRVQALPNRGGGRGIVAVRDIVVGELLVRPHLILILFLHLSCVNTV